MLTPWNTLLYPSRRWQHTCTFFPRSSLFFSQPCTYSGAGLGLDRSPSKMQGRTRTAVTGNPQVCWNSHNECRTAFGRCQNPLNNSLLRRKRDVDALEKQASACIDEEQPNGLTCCLPVAGSRKTHCGLQRHVDATVGQKDCKVPSLLG